MHLVNNVFCMGEKHLDWSLGLAFIEMDVS